MIKGGYIPTIGKNEDIQNVLFALEEGELSEPVKTEKGWHVFKIEEKKPERTKPFEEVKEMIKGELKREKLRTTFEDMKTGLREEYGAEIYEENLIEEEAEEEEEMGEWKLEGELDFSEPGKDKEDAEGENEEKDQSKLGIEKLFELASKQKDLNEAIDTYCEILKYHPDHDQAYKARFMIGFIYSEQLNDRNNAVKAFEKLIEDYPSCDLIDDARFMIEDLQNKKTIVFEEKKIAECLS